MHGLVQTSQYIIGPTSTDNLEDYYKINYATVSNFQSSNIYIRHIKSTYYSTNHVISPSRPLSKWVIARKTSIRVLP